MMQSIAKKTAVVAAGLLLIGACGRQNGADPSFLAAVPSFDSVSLEMEAEDAVAPDEEIESPSAAKATAELIGDTCHPHLFIRTHEVVARLNLHTAVVLNTIRGIVALSPRMRNGTTHIWERVRNNVIGKLTLTKGETGLSYSFKLELAKVPESGEPAFVLVASGESTSDGATPPRVVGTMAFDYSALQSVVPVETATGQLAVDFDVIRGVSKHLVFHFTDFLPRGGDLHGPRTGTYVYYGKPGVGGSLKYQDTVVLLCPQNPTALAADLNTVAEWYRAGDGSLHGRADTRGFGGQIAAGNTWMGVTCHAGSRVLASAENYWMMKVENSLGATLGGSSYSSSSSGPGACDPAFINGNASVPSLTDNASDFPFAASFNADGTLVDENPFLFPKIQ